MATSPQTVPEKLDLKRDEKLSITWKDGHVSEYSISLLRSMCPCAQCRDVREAPKAKTSLNLLPGNYTKPIVILSAELVGNYALRLQWSDDHASGIYSFEYLRHLTAAK